MPALKACLDQYEGRIYPGDILTTNDPYEGGSHLPDIFLFKPVWIGDRGRGVSLRHGTSHRHRGPRSGRKRQR